MDIVIQEAPDDLESGTKVYTFDDEEEEEKGIEALGLIKARSGTEYIQIHEELRESGGPKKLKVPYVRKKTFLKAKAHYALPTRELASNTLTQMHNPVKDFKFGLTMDGPSFIPIKERPEKPGILSNRGTGLEIEGSMDLSYERDSYIGEVNQALDPKKYRRAVPIQLGQLPRVEKVILENRNLFSPSIMAAEIDFVLYEDSCKTVFSRLSCVKKIIVLLNLGISTMTKATVYPTDDFYETSKTGLITRYTLVSFFFPIFSGYVVGYRRGLIYHGNWGFPIYGGIGLILSLATFLMVSKRGVSGSWKYFFKMIGFITSFLWLFMLSDMVVSIIICLNVLFNYQYSFMMISVFSFWAWMPVTVGSINLVRLMKSMPTYGGVIFNSFFVFGVSTLLQCIMHGKQEFATWPSTKNKGSFQLSLYIYINAGLIVFIFGFIKLRGMRYTRMLGILLVMMYLIATMFTFVLGFFVDRI